MRNSQSFPSHAKPTAIDKACSKQRGGLHGIPPSGRGAAPSPRTRHNTSGSHQRLLGFLDFGDGLFGSTPACFVNMRPHQAAKGNAPLPHKNGVGDEIGLAHGR